MQHWMVTVSGVEPTAAGRQQQQQAACRVDEGRGLDWMDWMGLIGVCGCVRVTMGMPIAPVAVN